MSEARILASTNPQYENRLFFELRVQYKKTTSSEMMCTQIVLTELVVSCSELVI
jgi:hypothetical protein